VVVAAIAAMLGLVAFGACVGALVHAYLSRKLYSAAKTHQWLAQRHSISAQTFADTARQAMRLQGKDYELAQIAREAAEDAWKRAAEHEASAEIILDRARALHTEMMT
jgi:hypothetical protein